MLGFGEGQSMRSFFRLTPAEKYMILEACCYVGVTRVISRVVPFRWIAKVLVRPVGSRNGRSTEDLVTARRVGWAVSAVSRTRVLHAVCLGQAIAAHLMLKRRGIRSDLFLGVAHEGSQMIAHAWVTSGDFIVTGAGGHERFAVVSTLSTK
jgi:hypothetical protein